MCLAYLSSCPPGSHQSTEDHGKAQEVVRLGGWRIRSEELQLSGQVPPKRLDRVGLGSETHMPAVNTKAREREKD